MESCRVCERPATHKFGRYRFCDIHHEHARRARGSLWLADLASLGLLVVLVGLAFAVERIAGAALQGPTLVVAGLLLAMIPAVVWLTFFHRRDRFEPEPRGMVLSVFALGALLAAGVGIPLANDVFSVSEWLASSTWGSLLGGILVLGFSQEFLKYAAVRFSVYQSAEFDERTDGIIYGTAAGLGYATVLNVVLVLSSGGIDLGAGAIRIVLTALAHASFGGLMGYFLGRQKLEAQPAWWMAAGVSLAAVLNGLFFHLRGAISSGGLTASGGTANPWTGLLLAASVALAVTWVLDRLIHRDLATATAAEAP